MKWLGVSSLVVLVASNDVSSFVVVPIPSKTFRQNVVVGSEAASAPKIRRFTTVAAATPKTTTKRWATTDSSSSSVEATVTATTTMAAAASTSTSTARRDGTRIDDNDDDNFVIHDHDNEQQQEQQQQQQEDPIEYSLHQWREHMDMNAIINTGLLLGIAIAILFKITTINSGDMTRGWTTAELAYRMPVDNWLSYSAVLNDAPIPTKAVTSATVYSIGDLIAQRTEGKAMGDLDRMRTFRSLVAGLIAHGPMSHYWYDISEGLFDHVLHWTAWWSFFPKVLLDQAAWGPFWNNTYILLLGLMKGQSMSSIWADVKRTTIPLVVSGLKLWPLAHCVTYGLIPVENRLLWVDIVEILWVTILATQAAGGGSTGGADDDSNAANADVSVETTTTSSSPPPTTTIAAAMTNATSAFVMPGH